MDWSSIAEGGISGAISAGLNLIGNTIGARQQYKYNSKLLQQQNDFNLDMWNKSNEYNDPSNVLKRYENAGINPSMALSGLSPANASPVSSGSGGFSMPNLGLSDSFASGIQSFIGLKTMLADLKLKEKQAQKTESETAYQDILNKWADSSEEQRIGLLRQNIDSLKTNQKLTDTEVKKLEEEIPFIAKLNEAQIQKFRSESQLLMQNVATEIQKRKNMKVEVSQMLANIAYLKALKTKTENEADKAYYDSQISSVELSIKNQFGSKISQAELKRIENESYGILMEGLGKMIDTQSKFNGIDLKGNPVNNILRMIQIIVGSDRTGGLEQQLPSPTSATESKVDSMLNNYLDMVYSGAHSHKTHRNPDFHHNSVDFMS